ncbi:MAG: hypothetical protein LUO91_00945 [Methanomicrobiales archaeon]|jgi:hypothetical protein|nr:hypothetical protein [Methanomicrobiales archaeon]
MSSGTDLVAGRGVQAGERLLIPVVRRQWFRSEQVQMGSARPVALAILEGNTLSIALLEDGVTGGEIRHLLGIETAQEPV